MTLFMRRQSRHGLDQCHQISDRDAQSAIRSRRRDKDVNSPQNLRVLCQRPPIPRQVMVCSSACLDASGRHWGLLSSDEGSKPPAAGVLRLRAGSLWAAASDDQHWSDVSQSNVLTRDIR